MTDQEVWLNEGEENERCFQIDYRVDSDETPSGQIVPEIGVISIKENGTELSNEEWKKVESEVYDELYRIVEGWGDCDGE